MRGHLTAQGADVAPQSRAVYARFVADEAARWKRIVEIAGIPQE